MECGHRCGDKATCAHPCCKQHFLKTKTKKKTTKKATTKKRRRQETPFPADLPSILLAKMMLFLDVPSLMKMLSTDKRLRQIVFANGFESTTQLWATCVRRLGFCRQRALDLTAPDASILDIEGPMQRHLPRLSGLRAHRNPSSEYGKRMEFVNQCPSTVCCWDCGVLEVLPSWLDLNRIGTAPQLTQGCRLCMANAHPLAHPRALLRHAFLLQDLRCLMAGPNYYGRLGIAMLSRWHTDKNEPFIVVTAAGIDGLPYITTPPRSSDEQDVILTTFERYFDRGIVDDNQTGFYRPWENVRVSYNDDPAQSFKQSLMEYLDLDEYDEAHSCECGQDCVWYDDEGSVLDELALQQCYDRVLEQGLASCDGLLDRMQRGLGATGVPSKIRMMEFHWLEGQFRMLYGVSAEDGVIVGMRLSHPFG